ncbi:MAG: hypothetical protein QXV73_04890 [Candidatus Micrarchaeia archaeon]
MEKIKKTKKPTEMKRTSYILVRLTDEEKERLKKLAYSQGLDMSEYVRKKVFDL